MPVRPIFPGYSVLSILVNRTLLPRQEHNHVIWQAAGQAVICGRPQKVRKEERRWRCCAGSTQLSKGCTALQRLMASTLLLPEFE